MFSSNGYEFLLYVFLTNPCQASYLQKAGFDVCVLERRNVVGGAAVTEELIPGLTNKTVATLATGRSHAPLVRSLEHGPCSQTHNLISWSQNSGRPSPESLVPGTVHQADGQILLR